MYIGSIHRGFSKDILTNMQAGITALQSFLPQDSRLVNLQALASNSTIRQSERLSQLLMTEDAQGQEYNLQILQQIQDKFRQANIDVLPHVFDIPLQDPKTFYALGINGEKCHVAQWFLGMLEDKLIQIDVFIEHEMLKHHIYSNFQELLKNVFTLDAAIDKLIFLLDINGNSFKGVYTKQTVMPIIATLKTNQELSLQEKIIELVQQLALLEKPLPFSIIEQNFYIYAKKQRQQAIFAKLRHEFNVSPHQINPVTIDLISKELNQGTSIDKIYSVVKAIFANIKSLRAEAIEISEECFYTRCISDVPPNGTYLTYAGNHYSINKPAAEQEKLFIIYQRDKQFCLYDLANRQILHAVPYSDNSKIKTPIEIVSCANTQYLLLYQGHNNGWAVYELPSNKLLLNNMDCRPQFMEYKGKGYLQKPYSIFYNLTDRLPILMQGSSSQIIEITNSKYVIYEKCGARYLYSLDEQAVIITTNNYIEVHEYKGKSYVLYSKSGHEYGLYSFTEKQELVSFKSSTEFNYKQITINLPYIIIREPYKADKFIAPAFKIFDLNTRQVTSIAEYDTRAIESTCTSAYIEDVYKVSNSFYAVYALEYRKYNGDNARASYLLDLSTFKNVLGPTNSLRIYHGGDKSFIIAAYQNCANIYNVSDLRTPVFGFPATIKKVEITNHCGKSFVEFSAENSFVLYDLAIQKAIVTIENTSSTYANYLPSGIAVLKYDEISKRMDKYDRPEVDRRTMYVNLRDGNMTHATGTEIEGFPYLMYASHTRVNKVEHNSYNITHIPFDPREKLSLTETSPLYEKQVFGDDTYIFIGKALYNLTTRTIYPIPRLHTDDTYSTTGMTIFKHKENLYLILQLQRNIRKMDYQNQGSYLYKLQTSGSIELAHFFDFRKVEVENNCYIIFATAANNYRRPEDQRYGVFDVGKEKKIITDERFISDPQSYDGIVCCLAYDNNTSADNRSYSLFDLASGIRCLSSVYKLAITEQSGTYYVEYTSSSYHQRNRYLYGNEFTNVRLDELIASKLKEAKINTNTSPDDIELSFEDHGKNYVVCKPVYGHRFISDLSSRTEVLNKIGSLTIHRCIARPQGITSMTRLALPWHESYKLIDTCQLPITLDIKPYITHVKTIFTECKNAETQWQQYITNLLHINELPLSLDSLNLIETHRLLRDTPFNAIKPKPVAVPAANSAPMPASYDKERARQFITILHIHHRRKYDKERARQFIQKIKKTAEAEKMIVKNEITKLHIAQETIANCKAKIERHLQVCEYSTVLEIAKKTFDKITDSSDAAVVHTACAIAYHNLNNDKDAVTYAELACKLDPGNITAHLLLAKVFIKTNKLQEAENYLRSAMHMVTPNTPEAINIFAYLQIVDMRSRNMIQSIEWSRAAKTAFTEYLKSCHKKLVMTMQHSASTKTLQGEDLALNMLLVLQEVNLQMADSSLIAELAKVTVKYMLDIIIREMRIKKYPRLDMKNIVNNMLGGLTYIEGSNVILSDEWARQLGIKAKEAYTNIDTLLSADIDPAANKNSTSLMADKIRFFATLPNKENFSPTSKLKEIVSIFAELTTQANFVFLAKHSTKAGACIIDKNFCVSTQLLKSFNEILASIGPIETRKMVNDLIVEEVENHRASSVTAKMGSLPAV